MRMSRIPKPFRYEDRKWPCAGMDSWFAMQEAVAAAPTPPLEEEPSAKRPRVLRPQQALPRAAPMIPCSPHWKPHIMDPVRDCRAVRGEPIRAARVASLFTGLRRAETQAHNSEAHQAEAEVTLHMKNLAASSELPLGRQVAHTLAVVMHSCSISFV